MALWMMRGSHGLYTKCLFQITNEKAINSLLKSDWVTNNTRARKTLWRDAGYDFLVWVERQGYSESAVHLRKRARCRGFAGPSIWRYILIAYLMSITNAFVRNMQAHQWIHELQVILTADRDIRRLFVVIHEGGRDNSFMSRSANLEECGNSSPIRLIYLPRTYFRPW
jgi:hypothetical protein